MSGKAVKRRMPDASQIMAQAAGRWTTLGGGFGLSMDAAAHDSPIKPHTRKKGEGEAGTGGGSSSGFSGPPGFSFLFLLGSGSCSKYDPRHLFVERVCSRCVNKLCYLVECLTGYVCGCTSGGEVGLHAGAGPRRKDGEPGGSLKIDGQESSSSLWRGGAPPVGPVSFSGCC